MPVTTGAIRRHIPEAFFPFKQGIAKDVNFDTISIREIHPMTTHAALKSMSLSMAEAGANLSLPVRALIP